MLYTCDPCVYFTFVHANKVEAGFMYPSEKTSGEAALGVGGGDVGRLNKL